jgi:antagonist of KipI
MAGLTVIEPGLLTTVQDLGRSGLAAMGVPEGGAANPLALRAGNRAAGNDPGAAALEMTMVGGEVEFDRDALIALGGGSPTTQHINHLGTHRSVPLDRAFQVRAGDRLRVRAIAGCRTYLCVQGGIRVPQVLGSRSTCLRAGYGGLSGRALRQGDRVEFADAATREPAVISSEIYQIISVTRPHPPVRATEGSHAAMFDRTVIEQFWSSEFHVSSQSDRTGLRLKGASIAVGMKSGDATGRMLSEGMSCGAVQVPPSGEPIVLMMDHPTTGGYPVIACVATVDLPVLGQLMPGERVGFVRVTQAEALAAFREQEQIFRAWEARP